MHRSVLASLVLLGALAARPAPSSAQQKGVTISGRVTNEAGAPLPNASVYLEGTKIGTVAGINGKYLITVPSGQPTGPATLVARLIGYKPNTIRVTIGSAPITQDFVLVSSPVQLEGMVVTALGIQRDKRSLGVAQQSVSAPELSQARETNIVNALDGKVAGVEVTATGQEGGSSRIVIRGENSITNNNQPLFIVDGVPIDNSAPTNSGFGGVDYGNTAQDINPNDIESISILKGANASALYGSRAANGVVLITTKSGKGGQGLGITASQNFTFENPLRLPDLQNKYGQGSNGVYEYGNGAGGNGGLNDNVNRSWGPPMDGRLIKQWWSNGQPAPWTAQPDNLKQFFNTGKTSTTSGALTAANDKADVRLGLTDMEQNGMYPTMTLRRVNASLNGGADISTKLSARASIQYTRDDGHNRPQTGYSGLNAIDDMIWGGRQLSMARLMHYKNPDGTQAYASHTTVNNPFWDVYMDPNADSRDRVIGSLSATYKFTPFLSATLHSATDWYRDWHQQDYADGNIAVNYAGGAFFEQDHYNRETNNDFLITFDHDVMSKLNLTVNAGGNRRDDNVLINQQGTPHLVVDGTYNIANSAVFPQVSSNKQLRRTNSLYGQAQFSYNNYAFIDVTGRNDWSSTLPAAHNSYFYPSVSGSFVFTDALPGTKSKFLSYGKLRGSWAKVGNDAGVYETLQTYSPGTPIGSVPTFAVPNSIPNGDLKPEQTKSWEAGLEMRFLNDRVSFDGTYYSKLTTNQIIPAQISGATGFTSAVVNAGSVTNKGVELQLGATPIRTHGGFSWDVNLNFARNRSEVTSLMPGLDAVVLGTYWGLSVEARTGQPYGTLYGSPELKNADGQLLLTNGLPKADPTQEVLGHYTPDWTGGIQNTFHLKQWDFSFLFDTKQGGQIFSTTEMFGQESGVLESSLFGREKAEALADGGGMVVPGIDAATGQPNTTKVTAQAYFNALFQVHGPYIFDASFWKLREVRLGYTVPSKFAQRMGLSSLYVAAVGRNLWLSTKVPDIDPETAFDDSNVQGIEYFGVPSARSFGFTVSVTP